MELEITATPRETLVWAPASPDAEQLRRDLTGSDHQVMDADPAELDARRIIPKSMRDEFDPARIFDVGTGPEARAALELLVGAGHELVWHRWQKNHRPRIWGVPVSSRRAGGASDSAVHFGITVRSTRGLGLRMTRENYARINKRSSSPRWTREMDPEMWDALDGIYEDAEHRVHTDQWCAQQQRAALENFDLNMAHFASLDEGEFDAALVRAVASQREMTQVTDLSRWDGVPGLYIMVLDEYRQVYVGATDRSVGIQKRIKQHWARTLPFDRLIWGDVQTSILSVDSFRALDTTRIFALKTTHSFASENPLLEQFPPQFTLNRIRGGRDAARLAGILGVDAVMKRRDLDPA